MGLVRRLPKVEKLERRRDVKKLSRAARYTDPVVDRDGRPVDLGAGIRRDAVAALGRVGDIAGAAAVRDALRDRDEDVRLAAIQAAVAIADEDLADRTLDSVARWPASERASRRQAVDALVNGGLPRAGVEMARKLLDPAAPMDDDAGPMLSRLSRETGDAEAVAAQLAQTLADADPARRDRAAQLLHWFPDEALERVIGALGEDRARLQAIALLGDLRDARAREPLAEILTDPDPVVRRQAVVALGQLKDPRAAEALLRASLDPDYTVRSEAVAALNRLGAAGVLVGLFSYLRPRVPSVGGAADLNRRLAAGDSEHPEPLRRRIGGVARRLLADS
jgi:HEAT repeat protein